METDKIQEACRRKYSARTAYSLRELKTREDWNEWQANVLGAAILMPQREIDLAVAYYAKGRKLIRVSEPSPEMQEKIRRARSAIVNQKMRMVKCPYCGHNAIAVFEDSRGHIQAKCKACGRETVFDVINMRRLLLHLHRR